MLKSANLLHKWALGASQSNSIVPQLLVIVSLVWHSKSRFLKRLFAVNSYGCKMSTPKKSDLPCLSYEKAIFSLFEQLFSVEVCCLKFQLSVKFKRIGKMIHSLHGCYQK